MIEWNIYLRLKIYLIEFHDQFAAMADSLHGVPRSPRTEGRSHQSPWPNEQRSTADRPVYIYKLPYCTYYQLCRYLDADRKWDMLGEFANYKIYIYITKTLKNIIFNIIPLK